MSRILPNDATHGTDEPLQVDATVTNTGTERDTQAIEFRLNDDEFASERVLLGPSDTESITVEFDNLQNQDPGEHTLASHSSDDSATTTLTVYDDDRLGDDPAILVLSTTAGDRHADAIEAGNEVLTSLGSVAIERHLGPTEAEDIQVDIIDDTDGNAAAFPDDMEELTHYDVVVWHNVTGNVLNEDQRAAFEEYLESGGGYVGIHAAIEAHEEWSWYEDLVGARADGRPEDVQSAELAVTDQVHPSTAGLPSVWERTDEWYDFDPNPRGDVHVLATIDEDTYEGATMTDGRADHPIAWCQEVEEGRSWYTAGGHTAENWEDDSFIYHIISGIMWAAGWIEGDATATVWDAYDRVELAGPDDLEEPMSMAIAPDGRIFCIERTGDVVIIDPESDRVTVALSLDVEHDTPRHNWGGLGIALDPAFEENGWLYLYYSPVEEDLDPDEPMPYNQLSRFPVENDEIDPDSEVEILRVHEQRQTCCHSAGALRFGPDGWLYLSTGDNVTPADAYAAIDDQSTDPNTTDARGTSGDTSDLRGKILRIRPREDGSYATHDDNLFSEARGYGDEIEEGLVRPEIFAMGLRNPFRFGVDEETGWVYVGDHGPGASSWEVDRGPIGLRNYRQIREPGNHGWPLVTGPRYPYVDYDFEAEEPNGPFDLDGPTNDSVNNDGLEELPPVEPATFYVPTGGNWDAYTDAPEDHPWEEDVWDVPDSAPFPELSDGAPKGGPLVRLPEERADDALPDYFDGKWFIAGFNTGSFHYASFDEDQELLELEPFLPDLDLRSPIDMAIGPEGRFHYIEWGTGGYESEDSRISRIEHS
ncbi:ThuA domain-containing protein [Natronococcus pandeyae]|uniref:ThuA domain-containing protein n=1 Tax=Natronococcus pandeyae TaxID=2055836 RepID=UPI001652DB23|nr:ThuA domain-containing protein [Natronococcus pandeyae]